MNEPELIKAAEATGGKFYSPLECGRFAQRLAQTLADPAGN